MISMWKDFVNTESFTNEKENAQIMGDKLRDVLENIGFECTFQEVDSNSAMALEGIWGKQRHGRPVLFSGHYDTVFEKGAFGDNPFRIEDGKAYGPGCLDMKGGIVIAVFIVKALQSIGYEERPIKFLFMGEEEKLRKTPVPGKFISEHAAGAVCAFNMETGLISNALCIGRKGVGVAEIEVQGVAAHAGAAFTNGRSAITEMAHKILDLQALTDLNVGTTVSVGTIKGGTIRNAIPGNCSVEVDVRFEKISESERIRKKFTEICSKNYIDGTHTSLSYWESMLPSKRRKKERLSQTLCRTFPKPMVSAKWGSSIKAGVPTHPISRLGEFRRSAPWV
jgi:glutamate carboxypeptidase